MHFRVSAPSRIQKLLSPRQMHHSRDLVVESGDLRKQHHRPCSNGGRRVFFGLCSEHKPVNHAGKIVGVLLAFETEVPSQLPHSRDSAMNAMSCR